MTSKEMTPGPSRVPPNGSLACFVCNRDFPHSERDEVGPEELERIQNTFYEVFGITTKSTLEPFRQNQFCVGCEGKVKELQELQEQLEAVRNEMASSIVSSYIDSSRESPNYELKRLIFEKWKDKVGTIRVEEPEQSVPEAEISEPRVPKPKVTKGKTRKRRGRRRKVGNLKTTKPKVGSFLQRLQNPDAPRPKPRNSTSEREVARLIQQNDNLNQDSTSDHFQEARCHICSKVCRNNAILEAHLTFEHAPKRKVTKRKVTKRNVGKRKVAKKVGSVRPRVQTTGALLPRPRNSTSEREVARLIEQNERLRFDQTSDHFEEARCTVCSKVCRNNEILEAHLKSHQGNSKWKVGKTLRKSGWKKKTNDCQMCGKTFQHKTALQKHKWRVHSNLSKNIKCKCCGKLCHGPCKCTHTGGDQSLSSRYEDIYSEDNGVELELKRPKLEPGEESHPSSLQANENDITLFQRRHPAFGNAQFNTFVKVEKLPYWTERPGPSGAARVDEEEKRPRLILKSVGWRANGIWITQQKDGPMTSAPKPLSQSNWQSFIKSKESSISNLSSVQAKGIEAKPGPPVKRGHDSLTIETTHWVDPRIGTQSPTLTNPAAFLYLSNPLAIPKTGATVTKPGPLFMSKSSFTTHTLRFGQKKPVPKPEVLSVRPPSSQQMTKLAVSNGNDSRNGIWTGNPLTVRFVDVQALLSGATDVSTLNNSNGIDVSITPVSSSAHQNNNGLVKTIKNDHNYALELTESDSEDDNPNILVRTLQSLAELEDRDGEEEMDGMENTETYIPGRIGPTADLTEGRSTEQTFHHHAKTAGNMKITMDPLATMNEVSIPTSPTESRHGGIVGYADASNGRSFATSKASQGWRRSADLGRPLLVPKLRVSKRSPPSESCVYTDTPDSIPTPEDEDDVVEDFRVPIITNVYSLQSTPPAPPPTIIPSSTASQPIVSATVPPRKRKSSPSVINQRDLDISWDSGDRNRN